MKSNEVILLSDIPNQSTETYAARYAGPYVIKSNLIDHGINAIVLDWFRFIKDNEKFFAFFEELVDENTKVVGISNTFLYPPRDKELKSTDSSGLTGGDLEKLDEDSAAKYSLYLWDDNNITLTDWFKRLRAVLDKYNKNAKIVLGGARSTRFLQMASFAPEDYCIKKYVDYIIIGMADYAIKQLIDKINAGEEITDIFKHKAGLNFILCDREPWKTPTTYVPVTRYNKSDCFEKSHWAGLEVGRGCAFNCKYCYYEKRFAEKKPMDVLKEELKRNYYDLGITGYNITADCFNDNRRFVGAWADMVASLDFKIEWASYVRVDPFHKWPEMMDEMIGSGYKAGWFGVETLCHAAGKAAGKGLNPDRVKELLALLKQKGDVWTTCYFILGLPKETKESLNDTLQWLLKQSVIDEVQTSILDIGPFIEELSGIIDFSDHSKNPDKYGFTKLEFTPEFYWEHEDLNLHDCVEINEVWKKAFVNHHYTRFGGSAHGEYVRIRDTGLSHKQTVVYMKTKFTVGKNLVNIDNKKKKQFKNYVMELSKNNIQRYYDNFLRVNGVRYA